jgi:hypothetical protein
VFPIPKYLLFGLKTKVVGDISNLSNIPPEDELVNPIYLI